MTRGKRWNERQDLLLEVPVGTVESLSPRESRLVCDVTGRLDVLEATGPGGPG